MNADGSNRTTLFDDPMRNAVAPVWAPGGDRIAFGLGDFVQTSPGREQLTSQLALLKADGTDLQVLRTAGDHVGYPSWSRDGNDLVFARFDAPNRGLRILDLRDGSVRTLHAGLDSFPAWSPVDDWILFTSAIEGEYDIYKIRSDGTGLAQLTRSAGNDAHPKWSPDGRWIAFASGRSGFKDETPGMSDGEIYVMSADGREVRKLTENTFEDGTPGWAPLPEGRDSSSRTRGSK
jgi:Tol biopolymer transport system component